MRETVREWQEEWIGTNGLTHELEVIISDSSLEAFRTEVYSEVLQIFLRSCSIKK